MRKSKGRQKLEMVKLSNESNLQVTFSKRRSGFFKKASELCILCGAEVVIIVFSPTNKVYSFGHPCVESMVERFITQNPQQSLEAMQRLGDHYNANAHELSMHLTMVLKELEAEKKRGEELSQMRKASESQCWWEASIDQLNPPQLEYLKSKLEDLREKVAQQAKKIIIKPSTAPQEFSGSSSIGGILQFDPNNTNINSPNKNIISSLPSPMIQSSALPQYFPDNSSFGTSFAFDPINNPPITNKMSPLPPYQPRQPLPFNSPPYHPHPPHPFPHPDPRFSYKFD